MDGLSVDLLRSLFESDKSSVLERFAIVGVILAFVRIHFCKVERSLDTVAASVKDLSVSLQEVRINHGERITKLENKIEEIKPLNDCEVKTGGLNGVNH